MSRALRGDWLRSVTSARNPAVRAAARLARRGPDPDGAFLVEGPQALREATAVLAQVFVTEEAAHREGRLLGQFEQAGVEVLLVPPAVLDGLAATTTPQGMVGVATLPLASLDAVLERPAAPAPLLVVLVEVRDPGNVGSIVRTADAAGCDAVVLAGDCVDPRNAKAVRASTGSLFHLPVAREPDVAAALAACRRAGLRLVATDPRASTGYTGVDFGVPTALVFGSEAHGLPEGVAEACDDTVAVPILGRAESLNLAATVAVVVYEAARQRGEVSSVS